MQMQLCTISPALATFSPFLPSVKLVRLCACGEPLTLEMERDRDACVDCLFHAAINTTLSQRLAEAPTQLSPKEI